MRTTGDETAESRASGDESATGQAPATDLDPTQVNVEMTGDPGGDAPAEPVGTEPETEPAAETAESGASEDPASGLDAADGDTTAAADRPFGDVSEEEAEGVVSDVFESVYGEEGDGLLHQIQDTLGLDFREILDILVGNDSGDEDGGAYGEGAAAEDGEAERVDSSTGPEEVGTGTDDPTARHDDGSNPATDSTDPMAEDSAWDDGNSDEGGPDGSGDIDLAENTPSEDPADTLDPS